MRIQIQIAIASWLLFQGAAFAPGDEKPEREASGAKPVKASYLGPMGYVITNDKAFAYYTSPEEHEKDWNPVGTFRHEGWIEWEKMGKGFVISRQCRGTLVRITLRKAERTGEELHLHYDLRVTSRRPSVSGFGFFWTGEDIAEFRRIHLVENGERIRTLEVGDP